ncbi:MAG: hypothetical protein ACO3LT_06845 [Ilumatobacteraceae bacterium]
MALITTGSSTPSRIRAGDTVRWDLTYSDYPAGTHALEYSIVSRDADISTRWRAGESGDTFQLRLTSADTSALIPGVWTYDIVITETSSGDRRRIGGGMITVDPMPGARREKTFNEEMVDILESYLRGNLKHGHESTTIRGQSISRMTMSDATALLNEFRSKAQLEKMNDRARRGLNSGMTGRFRFTL